MKKFISQKNGKKLLSLRIMTGLFLLTALFTQSTAAVFALSKEQRAIFDKGISHYDHEYVEAGKVARSIDSIPLGSACENAKNIWEALLGKTVQGKQLQAHHVAGIMGNMQVESSFYPNRLQGKDPENGSDDANDAGGGGYGLVQWTPGRKIIPDFNRLKNSFEPAATVHSHMGFQIQLLIDQLNGIGSLSEAGAGRDLMNQNDVNGATRSFMLKYERPRDQSGSAVSKRQGFGRDMLNKGTTGKWCN